MAACSSGVRVKPPVTMGGEGSGVLDSESFEKVGWCGAGQQGLVGGEFVEVFL